MGTTTTTFALNKPTVGGDDNAWGTDWNTNADKLDDLLDGTTGITPNLLAGWEVGGVAVTATAAELNILDGVTATAAEINVLDGIPGTLTATEIGYLDGVTSAIQTQLDAKYDSGDLASQAEAEAGTDNTKVMTPLRVAQAARPQTATAIASTSGTAIDFTGIPSWARRVTVMMDEVSTNGTSPIVLQVGNGSIVVSGYSSRFDNFNSTVATQTATTSFGLFDDVVASATQTAVAVLSLISGNTWLLHGTGGSSAPSVGVFSGRIALAGALDRVRITTSGGANTFDAGSINVMWE